MNGIYYVTYSGVIGGGFAVISLSPVEANKYTMTGYDYMNSKFDGTCTVDLTTQKIAVDFNMAIKPGVFLVQGTSPHDLPIIKSNLRGLFPPNFGDGVPQKCDIPPGTVYVSVVKGSNEYAPLALKGFPPNWENYLYQWIKNNS